MSRIRSSNTGPEKLVRSILHSMGYRFRINKKELPGKPDIVLPRYKTAIFINGCFWHMHKACKYASTPKSNTGFWLKKLKRNIERDKENLTELKKMGYKQLVIWECQLKTPKKIERTKKRIRQLL